MSEVNIETLGSYRGLKVVCWNLRSLAPKIAEFEIILDKTSPDIICISESWLTDAVPDSQLEIDGYTLFRYDRTTAKKGGGLCIYSKINLKTEDSSLKHLNICDSSVEIQLLRLQLPCTKPIIIVNTYRPPSGNLDLAIEHLQSVIDNLPNSAEYYVLGDFNVDTLASKSTSSQN